MSLKCDHICKVLRTAPATVMLSKCWPLLSEMRKTTARFFFTVCTILQKDPGCSRTNILERRLLKFLPLLCKIHCVLSTGLGGSLWEFSVCWPVGEEMANKFYVSLIPRPAVFLPYFLASHGSTKGQMKIRSQLPGKIFLSFAVRWYDHANIHSPTLSLLPVAFENLLNKIFSNWPLCAKHFLRIL